MKYMQNKKAPQDTKKQITVWLILLLAILFIILASAVASKSFKPIDLKITGIIRTLTNPFLDKATSTITWFGEAPQCFIIMFLSGLALFCARYRWEAVVLVVSPLLSIGLDMLLKLIIRYPGPMVPEGAEVVRVSYYTFPSGQVILYIAFFGFVFYLIESYMKISWKKTALLIFLGILIVSDGFCRIYQGAHWISDVIGAYIFGSMFLIITIQIYKYGIKRNFKLCRRK